MITDAKDFISLFLREASEQNPLLFYGVVSGAFFILLLILKLIFAKICFRSKYSDLMRLSGDEFEKLLSYLYRADGYTVRRIGGTGDFGVDLLVKKDGITTAVQAKRYIKNVSLSAVQEVYAGKTYYGADEAVVVTSSHFTRAARQLAEPCEVYLIDKDDLDAWIERLRRRGSIK